MILIDMFEILWMFGLIASKPQGDSLDKSSYRLFFLRLFSHFQRDVLLNTIWSPSNGRMIVLVDPTWLWHNLGLDVDTRIM